MANNVERLRTEKGWTQAELAKKANTSQQQIHRIEKEKGEFSFKDALQIATALQCDLADVFPEADNVRKVQTLREGGRWRPRLNLDADAWFLPVQFIFDNGQEIEAAVTEKTYKSLERAIFAEDDGKEFVIFNSATSTIALNISRVSYFTPKPQELFPPFVADLIESTEGETRSKEDGEDGNDLEPGNVIVILANRSEAIEIVAPTENPDEDEERPLFDALIDFDEVHGSRDEMIRIPDIDRVPHYFRRKDVLVFSVKHGIVNWQDEE